jgi:IS5 family transposase
VLDETTVIRFLTPGGTGQVWLSGEGALQRRALRLSKDTIVEPTIIAALSSAKNAEGERDSEMHKTNKGNG